MLVAGFSCVDFSKMNKRAKKLTDVGESGDTFRAILEYAKAYRPGVIILENVDSAPWDLIQAIWKNDGDSIRTELGKVVGDDADDADDADGADDADDAPYSGLDAFWDHEDPAYSAAWQKADAKNFYIPQTRTRRYMICLDRRRFATSDVADEAVLAWVQYMLSLERKASVSVEAFLLSEDDPRLQSAKDEMSKTGRVKRETDWAICNGRHEKYRNDEKLGTLRPILNWTNDGTAKPSSFLWTDWTLAQPERIWDSIEISYVRNAKRGLDSFYKP